MTEIYRAGRKNARNIYRATGHSANYLDDEHIGVMFTEAAGQLVVAALNAFVDRSIDTAVNAYAAQSTRDTSHG